MSKAPRGSGYIFCQLQQGEGAISEKHHGEGGGFGGQSKGLRTTIVNGQIDIARFIPALILAKRFQIIFSTTR